MGCIIKYKGQSISEEQFLQYLNKQIAINNLFNENESLANAVYEALGLGQESDLPTGNETISNIYSKLGTKTKSENVVIRPWGELKDATKPIIEEGIISTRVKATDYNFGNIFSHKFGGNLIKVDTVEEAVKRYINWILTGETGEYVFTEIQPETLDAKREWILEQLKSGKLKGKPIFYYKELGEPSHATALDYLINRYDWNSTPNIQITPQQKSDLSEKNIFTVEPIQSADKKAKSKAKIATQYIGFAEGIAGSSTALYAKQISEQSTSKFNISINKTKWTKDSPKQNPNTAYVFTENINSIGSSRVGGGSAVIRNNPNAVGIVTKKYYVYSEDRATSNIKGGWNQDFKDADTDFELFKKVNLEQFAKLDKFNSIIFPDSFANSLASIPNRFALWLQNELQTRYGLVTELNSKGTGLISKSIIETQSNIVNSGNYSSNDVIFVSIGGKRGNETIRKAQQDRTIREAIKALEAGATLITDNAAYVESNSYNEGEKRLAANLKAKGYVYSETIEDGNILGVWRKVNTQPTPQQKQQALEVYSNYLEQGGSKQDIEGFKDFVTTEVPISTQETTKTKKKHLGALFMNSVKFLVDTLGGSMMLESSHSVFNSAQTVLTDLGKDINNEELTDKITREIAASIRGRHSELGQNPRKDLDEVFNFLSDPANKEFIESNYILNSIIKPHSIFLAEGTINTIKSVKEKLDVSDLTLLPISWDQMNKQHPQFTKALVRALFHTSGFTTSTNNFYKYIPTFILNSIDYDTFMLSTLRDTNVNDLVNYTAIEPMIQNNYIDRKLVPEIRAKQVPTSFSGVFGGFVVIKEEQLRNGNYFVKDGAGNWVAPMYVTHKTEITDETGNTVPGPVYLYKYLGRTHPTKAENLTYVRMNTLGVDSRGNKIKENMSVFTQRELLKPIVEALRNAKVKYKNYTITPKTVLFKDSKTTYEAEQFQGVLTQEDGSTITTSYYNTEAEVKAAVKEIVNQVGYTEAQINTVLSYLGNMSSFGTLNNVLQLNDQGELTAGSKIFVDKVLSLDSSSDIFVRNVSFKKTNEMVTEDMVENAIKFCFPK